MITHWSLCCFVRMLFCLILCHSYYFHLALFITFQMQLYYSKRCQPKTLQVTIKQILSIHNILIGMHRILIYILNKPYRLLHDLDNDLHMVSLGMKKQLLCNWSMQHWFDGSNLTPLRVDFNRDQMIKNLALFTNGPKYYNHYLKHCYHRLLYLFVNKFGDPYFQYVWKTYRFSK